MVNLGVNKTNDFLELWRIRDEVNKTENIDSNIKAELEKIIGNIDFLTPQVNQSNKNKSYHTNLRFGELDKEIESYISLAKKILDEEK